MFGFLIMSVTIDPEVVVKDVEDKNMISIFVMLSLKVLELRYENIIKVIYRALVGANMKKYNFHISI